MSLRSVVGLASVCSVLFGSTAQAYCRTTTSPEAVGCPAVCVYDGVPLAWWRSDISYGFNERGFPGLGDAQLRSTFAKSFQAWEDVPCDGQSVGLQIRQLPGTTPLEEGPVTAEPNQNVMAHYDAAGWAEHDYAEQAFAVTAVWFDDAGQIKGADIGFNGGMDRYGDCATDQCTRVGLRTDLQNVATHEIGHFLGLSHSSDRVSTMSCSARAQDTDKRTLEADDISGLCASYPAATAYPDDHNSGSGCSLAGGARDGFDSALARPRARFDLSMLGWLGGLLVLRRRKPRAAR